MKRIAVFCIILLLASVLNACTYTTNRVDDFLDIADVGITLSYKPQLSLFVDAPFFTIWPIGWGQVDGYMLGLGQGKLNLLSPMHYDVWGGVMYGHETVSYMIGKNAAEDLDDASRKKMIESYYTGLAGLEESPDITPKYFVSCPHLFHIGFVGVVGCPRYWEMVDFLVGFTTEDASNDDDDGLNPGNDGMWMPVRLPF